MSATWLVVLGLAAQSDALVDVLAARAERALAGGRPCEARDAFEAAYQRSGAAKFLFNAAEVSVAAGDLAGALARYQRVRADREPRQ